jgi:hypothetical protein
MDEVPVARLIAAAEREPPSNRRRYFDVQPRHLIVGNLARPLIVDVRRSTWRWIGQQREI